MITSGPLLSAYFTLKVKLILGGLGGWTVIGAGGGRGKGGGGGGMMMGCLPIFCGTGGGGGGA